MARVIKRFVMFSLPIALLLAAGCATHNREIRTETAHYPATGQPTVVERETTVTTESEEGSGGIVSGTVNGVGEVLALPFRAAGGLIRAIF